MKAIGSLKNNWAIKAVARAVSEHIHRGFATAEKVETILREMKNEFDVRNINKLDESKVQEVAEKIAERVLEGEITAKTGQGYISALNSIIDYANHNFDKDIREIKPSELGIQRESIEYVDKSISQEVHQSFQNFLSNITNEKAEALKIAVSLQREFGLRFRESAGLNLETIKKGIESDKLELSRKDWTKNARGREIPIRTEQQRELLREAKNYIEKNNAVNLAGAKDWKDFKPISQFRNFADNVIKEFKQETGARYNFHAERHAYAQNTLENLKNSGISEKKAKGIVSSELGHSPDRDDITRIYLGR